MTIAIKSCAVALIAALCGAVVARAEGLPAATPESVGMSQERLQRIGSALGAEVDAGRIPGAVVLVARRGKLVYAQALGYQDKATGGRMTPDTIFRIYSMTKPLVSVAAMMLVEEGRIQLTDPVSKFLPALKPPGVSVAQADVEFAKLTYATVPAAREATVQDLLRHTAGFGYGEITQNAPVKKALQDAGIAKTTIDYDARDLTPAEQIDRLAKVPLTHQPGTVWEYSLASDVLGRVVEAASGCCALRSAHSLHTDCGSAWSWLNGFALAATFEGEFSDVTSSYAGKGVARYTW